MGDNNKKLHIVMFPWLAFGHMIPFLELSKSLASKGHHIFFVSTPRNLHRLRPKIPEKLTPFITLVPVPLPQVETLPSGAEATTDVGFEKGADLLKKAYDGLLEPMTKFLESSFPHPFDWIIYDFSCHWLPPLADKLGIRKVFFSIFFTRFVAFLGPSWNMKNHGAGPWTDPETLTKVPHWIPFDNTRVYYLPHEAKKLFYGATQKKSSGVSDLFRFRSCINGCDLIAVRSCMELEQDYIKLVENLDEKVVLPVGLLPPHVEDLWGSKDDTSRSIIGWLERFRSGEVVYVALGSELEPSQEQLNELALGLELSKLPFFWACRWSEGSSLELPKGFEERTSNRGLIWTSWVPQPAILSHDSVAGFLTHAGWSSIIEALQFGKPLIMLPLAVDQGLNARFMGEKKVGIEIPRNQEDGSFTRNSIAESLTQVLKNEAGKTYKDQAKKVSTIFADKDLHSQYIDKFSQYLCSYKPTN